MYPIGISVRFVCKSCGRSFQQVYDFIEHKKEAHFDEFQLIKTIIFEEKIVHSERDDSPSKSRAKSKSVASSSSSSSANVASSHPHPQHPYQQTNKHYYYQQYQVPTQPKEEQFFDGQSQPQSSRGNPQEVLAKKLALEKLKPASSSQHPPPHIINSGRGADLDTSTGLGAGAGTGQDPDAQNCPYLDLIYEKELTEIQASNNITIPTGSSLQTATDLIASSENYHMRHNNRISSTNHSDHFDVYIDYECKLCSEKLNSEEELQVHLNTSCSNHKRRNRYCVSCNKIFYNPEKLKDHHLRFHASEEEKASRQESFQCPHCPRKCLFKRDLQRHMMSHSSKIEHLRPFQCPHPNCELRFKLKFKLTEHIAIHSDARPFTCPHSNCDKAFKQKRSLNKHVRTHTGVRPYECIEQNCGKTFTTSSNLNRHTMQHHAS